MIVTVGGISYEINKAIYNLWNSIKDGKLHKIDQDRVYLVDGRERVGKSLWTLQQACYIDNTLLEHPERICFSIEEFYNAIKNNYSTDTETKVVIFDEAFRGLSSRSVLSKTNKMLIQLLMEMGQQNLVVFIVLPSFFQLDSYVAISRSHALFHIFEDLKEHRRCFKAYNALKKGKLHQFGLKKGWVYNVPTRIKGHFSNKYPGGEAFKEIYLKRKREALEKMNLLNKEPEESKFKIQRDKIILYLYSVLRKQENYTQQKIVDSLKEFGIEMTRENLSMLTKKYAKPA